jgi:hypothetical protein
MTTQRFTTTIVNSGTKIIIELPFNPNDVWGAKQRHHITGTVNGHAIRGLMDSEGTRYFLNLGAVWRRDNGMEVGMPVEVVLSPEGPQSGLLAPDIAAALEAEPQAKVFFEALATFYRKKYITWIEGARQPQTRANRIKEMLDLLKAEKKQK